MQKERCCKGCLKGNNSKEEEIFYPSPLAGEGGRRPGEGYTKKDITEQGNNFVDYPSSVCSDSVRQTTSPARGEVKQLGFTLIELLVVVLIIGILAAVAVPQYQKTVDKARYVQAMTLLRQIYNAEKLYHVANGKYTTHLDELDVDLPTPKRITSNSEGDSYSYSWGECSVHHTGYGVCYVKVGDGSAGYYKRWHDYFTGKASCWALPTNHARANRLCQAISGKKTGTDNIGGGFREYTFQER